MKKIKEYLSRERYLYLALNGRHSATTFEPSRGGKGIRLKTAEPDIYRSEYTEKIHDIMNDSGLPLNIKPES